MTNKLSGSQSIKQSTKQSGNLTDKQPGQKENLPENIPESQPGSQVERKPRGKKTFQKASRINTPPASLSVADLIRQRSAVQAAPEVLKTVTLKISPSLDEKIERYCFESKMKKQQFWADAAALYFETVENFETVEAAEGE